MRHRVISQMQQWKGKKKNKCFFGAKLIQSSLFVCVCVFFFYRSEWKIGQRGQDLSGLGAVG